MKEKTKVSGFEFEIMKAAGQPTENYIPLTEQEELEKRENKIKEIANRLSVKKPKSKIKFRASAAGKLMSGGNKITDKQLITLNKLLSRKITFEADGLGKPLTENMEKNLQELIAKRDAPFEFGETSKTYLSELWLYNEFEYRNIIWTDEIMKGMLCEQDSIGLVEELLPAMEFRTKNTASFENEYFTGTPDVVLEGDGIVEDVKTCWDIKTFFNKKSIPELYFAQAQVYMNLTGLKKFRLHYCLIDTPESLIERQVKNMFRRFGSSEENPHFTEYLEQLQGNHMVEHIPANQRLKTFDIEYDPNYIKELTFRAKEARKYYKTLKLLNHV